MSNTDLSVDDVAKTYLSPENEEKPMVWVVLVCIPRLLGVV